jgi:hypothetical protein
MNPLSIESALRTAFTASAFPSTTIYLGTDYEEMPPESLNLIVSCADIEHSGGGSYRATVTIRITAPALLGADSLSTMTTALNGVRGALDDTYLSTNWPSGTPYYAGVWIQNTRTSHDKNEWTAEVQALVGVSE